MTITVRQRTPNGKLSRVVTLPDRVTLAPEPLLSMPDLVADYMSGMPRREMGRKYGMSMNV